MSEFNRQGVELKEPPAGLLTAPINRVTALMDDPDEAVAAMEDLVQAGFQRDQIFVLCGPKGAERMDVSGKHHGLRGRLYRFVERALGELGDVVAGRAEHMAGGGLWMSVPATEDQKSRVADILGRHGGHGMLHHGKFHWVELEP